MDKFTRRHAIALGGAVIGASILPLACAADVQDPEAQVPDTSNATDDRWARERERVRALGFTDEEADCWEFTARAAGVFFALPVLHEMDAQEVAEAIHVIQNKLLSRPTYRRYQEMVKQGKP